MRILIPSTSVLFSFLYILFLFLFLHCHSKNNKNKQIVLAAAFLAMNNSNSACDAGIVASNILIENQTRNIIEEIDCNEISNFKFDSRVFSPFLNSAVNQLKFENTVSIFHSGNGVLFPMPTVLFNTSRSIFFDPVGYKTNPRLYDYTEYRAMLFYKNGTHTGIEAASVESAESAFRLAFEKCQKEFLKR